MILTLAHIAVHTLRHRLFGTRTPLVLSLSVTSRCNLRCVYCYAGEDNRNAADVPLPELIRIVNEFHALGTRVFMLQGGEPLLHPHIDAVIAHIKAKGAYCAVTTNGLGLPDHLAALKGIDQVQLSIDGDETITDANRGRGVHAALLEAIRLCDRHRIPFHLHTVLTRRSTEGNTLDPLQELATRHGTYVNFCIPAATGSWRDRSLATTGQLQALYRTILERKRLGLPTNNSEQGLRDIVTWTAEHPYDGFIRSDDPEGKRRYPKCVMGELVCWLDSSGMLHPCALTYGKEGFCHSIREYGVRGAWERLGVRQCHYCAGSTEFNNLFRFRPAAVANSLKFLFRRRGSPPRETP